MFDIEGIPPDLDDDLGRIFLWGIKVYGPRPSAFLDAVARFDGDGDRDAWFEFLANAHRLFGEYGADLPFVHWSHYEVTKVRGYLERYGDDEHETAARVLENLVDLYRVTRETWVLPLLSYSLKEVEKHAGFRRSLSDANGAWAMAQYIEAVEKNDEEHRNDLMAQICLYNEEDLDATWEVLRWLLRQEDRPIPGEAS